MKQYLFLITISAFLILLSAWLLCYGFDQRRLYYGKYAYGKHDVEAVSRLPEVLFQFGGQAWQGLDAGGAAALFRQVVVRNPLHMDSWFKLAQAEIETGNVDNARKIMAFCDTRIKRVLRWKWTQTLLAHDLAMKDIFRQNVNYLIDRQKWLSDIFYLLDTHTDNQTDQALALLTPGNRSGYLQWLIRWKKAEAARAVWAAIEADGDVTDEILDEYVHFLVSQKDIPPAAALWRRHAAVPGMTNAGFEKEITHQGFGWRIHNNKNDNTWQSRRVYGQSHQGAHALRVSFYGRKNLSWHHIYQIVPVIPERPYRLTYWCKSKGITTDQGPFVEILSYDAKGLYQKGPMVLGSHDWAEVAVAFSPPTDCHAVVVRLRRNASLRFDNKIQGVLWLDDFALTLQELEYSKSTVAEGIK